MATTYKELCDSVYTKIKDYNLVKLLEKDADDIIKDYIRPAILKFECCNQDLSDRDDVIESFNIDLSDINFEILTNFMVIEYLDSTYVRTTLMLESYMSNTDFHKYDNERMLSRHQSTSMIIRTVWGAGRLPRILSTAISPWRMA